MTGVFAKRVFSAAPLPRRHPGTTSASAIVHSSKEPPHRLFVHSRFVTNTSSGNVPHVHANYLLDLVVQSRHRLGSPLELPLVFAAAFF